VAELIKKIDRLQGKVQELESGRDFDVMLSDESINEGSDAWMKLEISPKAVGSVPYGNFRINVYQHSGNRKTGGSGENKFYYAPIALLDIYSGVSSFNDATNQAEMKFRIEMWNEDVQAAVARWIKQEVDDTVKDSLVQVLPFEKLILTGSSSSASQQSYRLPKDWMPYQLQKDVRFKMTCFARIDCDQLANQMRLNPDQFSHLRLLFSIASDKTLQKQVNIRTESIQLSELVAKLEQRLPQSEIALLNTNDEQRLLSEFAAAIVVDSFDDTDVVPANSEAQLLKPIKDVLISTGKTIKDQSDKLWNSAYWRDENNRPDRACKAWTEAYKKLDAEKQKALLEAFDSNSGKRKATAEQVRNLLDLIRESKLLHDQMVENNDEALNRFYDESKDHIQWDKDKFVPKSWSPIRLDMAKLRNPNSLKDKNVKVKYSRAALSIAVNIPMTVTSFSTGDVQSPMVRGLLTPARPGTPMPTNCKELRVIGHNHPGFYMVRGSTTAVQTIYCDFLQTNSDHYQTTIGFNDIKSTPVYFYVQRNSDYGTKNTNIPFQVERVNVGSGMDIRTGIFTVPKPGRYFFSFSGVSSTVGVISTTAVWVDLNVNGAKIGMSNAQRDYDTLSLQATLNLKRFDKVTLYLRQGTLQGDQNMQTHFTGMLLEEDLDFPTSTGPVAPPTTPPPTGDPPGFAHLINKHGKCLAATTTGNGNTLTQTTCLLHPGQQWSHNNPNTNSQNNHICNVWGLCIASPGNTNKNTDLVQWNLIEEAGQKFTFAASSTAGYTLVKNGHGKCIAANANGVGAGVKVVATDCRPAEAGQQWKWQTM